MLSAVSPPASNPLLQEDGLPAFSKIQVAHIEPALDYLLADNRQQIEQLVSQQQRPSWDNLVAPLEQLEDRLSKMWSPVSHLNGVMNSDELRVVYNACLPKLTAYYTELGQHEGLFKAYQALADSDEFKTLNVAQQKAISNALRDFRLSGVALQGKAHQRYGEIQQRLAELSTLFSNNVLDATQGWYKQVESRDDLTGLPESTVDTYRRAAVEKGLDGFVISLDIPAYLPLMQYCQNRPLRQEMYRAYTTRASDQGPTAGQWDNSELIGEILALRHELAQLLGFNNYAECSLATKMAESPEQVLDFLYDLAEKTRPMAQDEYQELVAFAKADQVEALEAWDVPYYSEKLRVAKYALSQEELRPYFPAERVVQGMLGVVAKLFAVEFRPREDIDSWHADVRYFDVLRGGEVIAGFYLDIYARAKKRGGAWMAGCRSRRLTSQGVQLPVAYLTCNFTPPGEQQPSLLTHNEVTTLFHEFGHGLHHMLTQIDVAAVAGIHGVAWDAVELPSQFLENWCWSDEAIALISGHYQTGEPLPAELLDKMLKAKNFQSGMQMMRQLEFAIFDLELHAHYQPEHPEPVLDLLNRVRSQVAVYAVPDFNRFTHSFTHIFAGGYAAGYYSYKWAEVLSADAFASFEEEGLFNQETGRRFLREILEQGGARDALELFVAFRGRQPSIEPLLRHSGIVSQSSGAVQ